MKKIIEQVEGEGFEALLGIYTGKLVGVNDTCVLLDGPKIVYETGGFDVPTWKDAQALPNQLYVQTGCIESFGILK